MKSIKPILLVLAAVLITITLFSFKKDEPAKEYCKVIPAYIGVGYTIIYDNSKIEKVVYEKLNDAAYLNNQLNHVKIINRLSKEGWNLTQLSANNNSEILYFEK